MVGPRVENLIDLQLGNELEEKPPDWFKDIVMAEMFPMELVKQRRNCQKVVANMELK